LVGDSAGGADADGATSPSLATALAVLLNSATGGLRRRGWDSGCGLDGSGGLDRGGGIATSGGGVASVGWPDGRSGNLVGGDGRGG
jgi:hypothetical protein